MIDGNMQVRKEEKRQKYKIHKTNSLFWEEAMAASERRGRQDTAKVLSRETKNEREPLHGRNKDDLKEVKQVKTRPDLNTQGKQIRTRLKQGEEAKLTTQNTYYKTKQEICSIPKTEYTVTMLCGHQLSTES